ncbi:hypothetical protein QBC47DRAFT_380651 [Echria macrotheca]|uniref:Uncharacterized protein n=1 Tax=Echria macrotheca TaxID=438768 RepID=A0AAJ0BC40_9PEZI|nr:hypothetical protein QBC47DRAFT_380651 [Echria macrotheca]
MGRPLGRFDEHRLRERKRDFLGRLEGAARALEESRRAIEVLEGKVGVQRGKLEKVEGELVSFRATAVEFGMVGEFERLFPEAVGKQPVIQERGEVVVVGAEEEVKVEAEAGVEGGGQEQFVNLPEVQGGYRGIFEGQVEEEEQEEEQEQMPCQGMPVDGLQAGDVSFSMDLVGHLGQGVDWDFGDYFKESEEFDLAWDALATAQDVIGADVEGYTPEDRYPAGPSF